MTQKPATAPPVCLATHISPGFGEAPIISKAGLRLGAGEAVMITGANGAGKTTLLRALAGLAPLHAGSIAIAGFDLMRDRLAAQKRLVLIGHGNGCAGETTPRESLSLWAGMRGLAPTAGDIDAVLKRAGLAAQIADTPIRILSAGQKRRAALLRLGLMNHIRATATTPLWLLDEPQTALDDNGVARLTHDIATHLQNGGAAVIASHHALPLKTKTRHAVITNGQLRSAA